MLQNLRIVHKKREWQEQGAREAAWKLAKNVFKLKEHQRAAFFSSPENRCLLASMLKPEEREFVVDSGASMHMISKKDLSNAEMDTLTKSCSPTIVITANGEVQTQEEAIVYVKELDIFLTMKVLEKQYCRSESFAMKTGVPTNVSMVKNHISLKMEFGLSATQRTSFPSWSQACQVLWIFIILTDTYETGESFFSIFFILTFFTFSSCKCGTIASLSL